MATTTAPKALVGASVPRSGHHFLQTILSTYYGRELFYCEFYAPKNCCRTVPCTRRGEHIITYQKNHDRELELQHDLRDVLYIVQYRHPVPEALSDRELDLQGRSGRRNTEYRRTREHYVAWLARKAVYYRKFHDKWIARRPSNAVYLDYEALARDAAAAIRPIISWVSNEIDEGRLQETLQKTTGVRVSGPAGRTSFNPRVLQASSHFDTELLGAFEDYVLTHCPHFGYARELSGTFEGTPFHGLVLFFDSDEPLPSAGEDRVAAAAALAPGHPEIWLRLIQDMIASGRLDDAITQTAELIARNPHFLPAYRTLFSLYRKLKTPVPPVLLNGTARLACAGNAGLLVEIGAAYAANSMSGEAIDLLSEAIKVDPEDGRAHRILTLQLINEGRWSEALPIAERAALLDPKNAGNEKRLARIRKNLE